MVRLVGQESSEEFQLIPENEVVNARLQDVELRSFRWDDEDVEKLKWVFVVTDPGDFQGKEIFGDTSTTFTSHPNCKAFNWATAITGIDYTNKTLDTDDILGMPARILIGHKKDKQNRVWMRVREVLPPSRQTGAVAPNPANVEPEDAPF